MLSSTIVVVAAVHFLASHNSRRGQRASCKPNSMQINGVLASRKQLDEVGLSEKYINFI